MSRSREKKESEPKLWKSADSFIKFTNFHLYSKIKCHNDKSVTSSYHTANREKKQNGTLMRFVHVETYVQNWLWRFLYFPFLDIWRQQEREDRLEKLKAASCRFRGPFFCHMCFQRCTLFISVITHQCVFKSFRKKERCGYFFLFVFLFTNEWDETSNQLMIRELTSML